MNGGLEPQLPLVYSYEDSYYKSLKVLKDVVKQNLKNLFLTAPGEKRRDLKFGININKFVFERFTQETRQDIITAIQEQVSKYMPFIQTKKIDINFVEQINELYIGYKYFISNLNEEDILHIAVKSGK